MPLSAGDHLGRLQCERSATNGNGATLSYDLNGAMTYNGATTYSCDARNRLFSMNSAGFGYDATGRRTQNAAGTGFFYDGVNDWPSLLNPPYCEGGQ